MNTLDVTAFGSLVFALTQVVKTEFNRRGIDLKEWSAVLSFVFGGIGVYLMNHQPQAWDAIAPILLMFAAPGGVSFVKELKRGKRITTPEG